MPIILKEDHHATWIDPATSVDDARELLTQRRDGELVSHRVSRAVNSKKAQGRN